MDIAVGIVGLFAAAIPLALLVAMVRLSSEGPGIFKQTRLGRNEKPFTLYKIRTMKVGTKNVGTHEISAAELTPLGHWLRRLKLDEVPQLWNVLRGDMSLVGPRPCLPSQTELVDARRRRAVFAVRPGVTGFAQIRGVDMSEPQRLAVMDSEGIARQSFFGDLRLLWATIAGAGRGDRLGA